MASDKILYDAEADDLELCRCDSSSSSATLGRSSEASDEEQGAAFMDNFTLLNVDDEAFEEPPEFLISEDTLVYVGFTRAKAQELWIRWVDWTMRFEVPLRVSALSMDDWRLNNHFLSFIVITVQEGSDDSRDDDNKWRDCLQSHGVNLRTQDFLLNHNYTSDRREIGSCMALFLNFIEMRYARLSETSEEIEI